MIYGRGNLSSLMASVSAIKVYCLQETLVRYFISVTCPGDILISGENVESVLRALESFLKQLKKPELGMKKKKHALFSYKSYD